MRRPASAFLALALSAGCASGGIPGASTTASTTTPTTSTTTTAPPSTTTTSSTTSTTTTTTTTTTATTTTTTAPVDVRALARTVLLVGVSGWGVDEKTAAHLAGGGSGLILFSDNIGGAEQLRSLTREAACAAAGPILIAVDQEIGAVARLRGLVTPLPTTAEAVEMTPLELEITGQLLGDEMLALGLNVDLAPVLDVVNGPNPVLRDRHLGGDPDVVAELGTAFLRGLQQAGVVAVPKHFPGHGRSTANPHTDTTRIDASLEDLEAVDFVPFREAFAAGALAVMVGHPIYEAIDPDLPASISPAALTMLREDFGFDGVAMTDSLSMAGVAGGRDPGSLAVQALAAGEDLLLVVDPSAVEDIVTAIVAAVATGDLSLARLQEAASRDRALAAAAAPVSCDA
jgi:beta-N-acetylhexosaminidase